MTIESFAEYLITHVRKQLPPLYKDAEFKIQHCAKPGNITLTAIIVLIPSRSIPPCVFINELYEKHFEGVHLSILIESFRQQLIECTPTTDLRLDWITDFGQACNHIVSKLIDIRPGHNDQYLEGRLVTKLEHTNVGMIYDIDLSKYMPENPGTIPVTKQFVKGWNVLEKTVKVYAAKNTPTFRPATIRSLPELITECLDMDLSDSTELYNEWTNMKLSDSTEPLMYVVTNKDKDFGANAILYPHVQDTLQNLFPDGYYVLPSSVHETIVIPKVDDYTPQGLWEIVKEANQTIIAPEDLLADDVFIVRNRQLISCIHS